MHVPVIEALTYTMSGLTIISGLHNSRHFFCCLHRFTVLCKINKNDNWKIVLFLRYFADISVIYHTYKRHITTITWRYIGGSHNISPKYRSCEISCSDILLSCIDILLGENDISLSTNNKLCRTQRNIVSSKISFNYRWYVAFLAIYIIYYSFELLLYSSVSQE